MLKRLTVVIRMVFLLPGWALLLVFVVGGLATVMMLVAVVSGGTTSSIATDFHYQCDSAIGPDPSATETTAVTAYRATTASRSDDDLSASEVPTSNPYADVTAAPDDPEISDWERACVSAMRSAPYQLPALHHSNAGLAVDCARLLATARVATTSAASAEGGAELSRTVIYQASHASATGRCGGSDAAAPAAPNATCRQPVGSAGRDPVLLPDTVAAQGMCGQRVDRDTTSAGDLVFWNYRAHAPTRVGIALGRDTMVTADPASGQVVEQPIPANGDVRVKRVLAGGS